MKMNLNLIQTQKLIMTPELKQSIEILQYNSVELNEFIHEEMLSNPVLQRTRDDHDPKEIKKIDWKEAITDFGKSGTIRHDYESKDEQDELSYDNLIAIEETLTVHLLSQLQYATSKDLVNKIGEYVIQNLNNNGYLDLANEPISKKFGVSESFVEDVIKLIQTFDPIGVCARSLKECLLIQAAQIYPGDHLVETLINEHLNDLAENRIVQIAKIHKISVTDVQGAFERIKLLEPKPGRGFSNNTDIKFIIPDVFVEKVEGQYVIKIAETTAPRLFISTYYKELLNQQINDQASDYISSKLNSAMKLIKSIEQRKNTILRVVTSITEHQQEFFDKGQSYLKTLKLKDIADELEIHESTVSRAVSGKYLQCSLGVFEIKYFFQSGVVDQLGDGISSGSVKFTIKEMIEKEDPKKPLSDHDISEIMIKSGVNISRRTIAKYRDELNIPSSTKRKKF